MKSRHRVKTYGEVFTPRHMVDRMLDLVREELETGPDFVDKTFLEPAAGRRQLPGRDPAPQAPCDREAATRPRSGRDESLFALASIYGIELLEDNHRDAKAIMLAEFLQLPRRATVSPVARTRACSRPRPSSSTRTSFAATL